MPTDKKVALDTRVRPKSKPVVRPTTRQSGLDTRCPPTNALLEGAATQTIQQAEDSAWDPCHPSRPPRTDAESAARERVLRETLRDRARRPPVQPKGDDPVIAPTPEPPSEYSHGDHGVLLSDNQDKPYIKRQFDWQLDGELDRQLSQEAAERRR